VFWMHCRKAAIWFLFSTEFNSASGSAYNSIHLSLTSAASCLPALNYGHTSFESWNRHWASSIRSSISSLWESYWQ
jgi:hypothetical protein